MKERKKERKNEWKKELENLEVKNKTYALTMGLRNNNDLIYTNIPKGFRPTCVFDLKSWKLWFEIMIKNT